MGILRIRVVVEYKDSNDYTQDMMDVWAHNFEIEKWWFCKIYPDITLSTIVFSYLEEKASSHMITSNWEDEGQNGYNSDGFEATEEETDTKDEAS